MSPLRRQLHPQWQGVHKHSEGPFGPRRTLQASSDHGAEHHIIASGASGQHLGPGHMEQDSRGHFALAGLRTDTPAELVVQLHLGLFDIRAVALDFQQVEWRGGRFDIGQAATEILFVNLDGRGEDMRARLAGRQPGPASADESPRG